MPTSWKSLYGVSHTSKRGRSSSAETRRSAFVHYLSENTMTRNHIVGSPTVLQGNFQGAPRWIGEKPSWTVGGCDVMFALVQKWNAVGECSVQRSMWAILGLNSFWGTLAVIKCPLLSIQIRFTASNSKGGHYSWLYIRLCVLWCMFNTELGLHEIEFRKHQPKSSCSLVVCSHSDLVEIHPIPISTTY